MQVNLGGRDVLVPQQVLDRPQVGAGLQQMGRKAVAQGVARHPLVTGTTRASFAVYNTHAEVEALADSVAKAVRLLG
jgi:selenocysteine lyase/cysteine desulfurase